MNYIEQIKGFWIAQEVYQLGTSEIALYFYLLEVCNKTGWTGAFYRNNYKVMSDLSIRSYKTFQSIRDKLKSAEIIEFRQKNGDANCQYFINELGKKYLGKGQGLVEGSGKGKGKGSVEVNINQTETKPNYSDSNESGTEKKLRDSGLSSNSKKEERKKSSAQKKKEDTTEYWQALVDTWFEFNKNEKDGFIPSFKGSDPRDLKQIVENLKKRTIDGKVSWNQETAIKALNKFLGYAIKDDFLNKNFLLSNLNKQIDKVIANKGEINGTKNFNSNRAAGRSAKDPNLADTTRYADKA